MSRTKRTMLSVLFEKKQEPIEKVDRDRRAFLQVAFLAGATLLASEAFGKPKAKRAVDRQTLYIDGVNPVHRGSPLTDLESDLEDKGKTAYKVTKVTSKGINVAAITKKGRRIDEEELIYDRTRRLRHPVQDGMILEVTARRAGSSGYAMVEVTYYMESESGKPAPTVSASLSDIISDRESKDMQ